MFYIYIPPQTPALDKGGACGKALPCTPKGVFEIAKSENAYNWFIVKNLILAQ